MSDEETTPATGLAGFVLENRSWMQGASLLMIVYAVWAVIEVLSNTWFHSLQGITIFETGTETNINPDDLQRNNSGMIIASGAVLGLFGLFAQYVYRGAPMVDSSMAAAAAMILDQAAADRVSEEEHPKKTSDEEDHESQHEHPLGTEARHVGIAFALDGLITGHIRIPSNVTRLRSRLGSGSGTAESRALVYGWVGSLIT